MFDGTPTNNNDEPWEGYPPFESLEAAIKAAPPEYLNGVAFMEGGKICFLKVIEKVRSL